MTQINADSRPADLKGETDRNLQRTFLLLLVTFLLGIGLGFFLRMGGLLETPYGYWILLLVTLIPYWFVAFTSRGLNFKYGWRIIGSLALSIGAAYFTLIAFIFISVLISGRGT